ncbi:MAG: S-layer homology domain-containing protein [Moorellales bacterium]
MYVSARVLGFRLGALVVLLAVALGLFPGGPPTFGPRQTPSAPVRQFLNNRAADLTGVRPLSLAEVATPDGLTGRGQILGLADSGLDGGSLTDLHPDLVAPEGQKPKVVALQSVAGRSLPDDPNGHGTHMAGTLVGTGKASDGRFRGLAPEAQLYFQALLDPKGELSPPSNLSELFGPAYRAGVRVHVDGWGGGLNHYEEAAAQIDAFIRSHPDFLAVFGAGNAGPYRSTLTDEANAKNALVVGASANPRPALDTQALDPLRPVSFSSRGPAEDGRLKPDLLAPGQALVSTRSRLIESNFTGNEAYAVMGGTSMAAAVAGAALALLREYLEEAQGLASPSAALLKALLINGARVPEEGPGEDAFGVLDLAGTVLALKEGSFRYADVRVGLGPGETFGRYYQVKGPGPLKVTLAWTDPPAEPGRRPALVNDLDLVVVAPDGRVFHGNHFLHPGARDGLNNVEQVYLPNPRPGRYWIAVQAATLTRPAVAGVEGLRQDFALVWGQAPLTGILSSWEEGELLTLADGEVLPWPQGGRVVIDERVSPFTGGVLVPGAELYWVGGVAYAFARTWKVGAVQISPSSGGTLFMEADPRRRDGGYLLSSRSSDPPLVNGRPNRDLSAVPLGARVRAIVNPFSQRLWQVRIEWQEKQGYLGRIDDQTGQIWLLGQESPYRLKPEAVVTFVDRLAEASTADAPFAATQAGAREDLVPGQKVRLMLGPDGKEVLFLSVERELAVGRLRRVEPGTGRITLQTGRTFTLFPNGPVWRNGEEAKLGDLCPGDHLTAVLLPGGREAVSLVAYSRVLYGRVLYATSKPRTLFLVDELNRFRRLDLSRAQICRWGQEVDPGALVSGTWVRVVLFLEGEEALRVDVAETVEERSGIFSAYDPERGWLRLSDGSQYYLSSAALISKQGYYFGPQDLVRGERVKLWVLAAPAPWDRVVAGVQVESSPGRTPSLAVTFSPQEGGFILSGTTSAHRLYLYRADGRREEVPLSAGGYFAAFFGLEQSEETVRVVGLNLEDGGWVQQKLVVRAGFTRFADTAGHWAEGEILSLARAGILFGYPDGTFRPDRPVTRAELAALLTRVLGLEVVPDRQPHFRDAAQIPVWARATVAAAQSRGLVGGFPDGSFRPQAALTRLELACFLARAAGRDDRIEISGALPFADAAEIPAWAGEEVAAAYVGGLLRGREDGSFAPRVPASRAEVAVALARFRARLVQTVPPGQSR